MVAITVILAAVIGAFVLEIGDRQETAPNTSFESNQRAVTLFVSGEARLNYSAVGFTHAGGSVVDRESIQTKVDGNSSTYDWHVSGASGGSSTKNLVVPSTATLTGESDVLVAKGDTFPTEEGYPYGEELTSGGGITVRSYGAVSYTALYGCLYDNKGSDDKIIVEGFTSTDFDEAGYDTRPGNDDVCAHDDGSKPWERMDLLGGGEDVTLVWEASSGGKTQTLFRYTVQ
jgi:FlaG/FlaF family flagellin (archaellin)